MNTNKRIDEWRGLRNSEALSLPAMATKGTKRAERSQRIHFVPFVPSVVNRMAHPVAPDIEKGRKSRSPAKRPAPLRILQKARVIDMDAQGAQGIFWSRLACSPGYPPIRTGSSPELVSRAGSAGPVNPAHPAHRCSIGRKPCQRNRVLVPGRSSRFVDSLSYDAHRRVGTELAW